MIALALAAAVAATASWVSPVPPPLVIERPFLPPAAVWGPGHRGVDLAASPGDPIRSAGSGRVAFAGVLAGRFVISVAHPQLGSGWRTTYEGVRPTVSAGDAVRAGEAIGILTARGTHCTCLHWGLRHGSAYADPLGLLHPILKPR